MISRARSLLSVAFASAVLASLPVTGRGTTFNWTTTPAFPAGPTVGNTALQVYGGLGQVTVTNVGGGAWQAGYPKVDVGTSGNGDTNGGTSSAGLQLYVASEPSTTAFMKVTFTFGYNGGGASNVSMTLWDVDTSGNFTDQIKNIVGVTSTGVLVPLHLVGSTDNTITNNDTTSATATGSGGAAGNTTSNGNVTVTSGTVPIQAITFEYLDVNPTTRTTQIIGFSPITFTPMGTATPEVGSALGGLVLCGGVIGFGVLRRRRTQARA